MTLAARYRHTSVLLGAFSAFLILNTLAVIFGSGLAQWIPEQIVSGIVALLFAIFGINSLLAKDKKIQDGEFEAKHAQSIFVTTFVMLFLAEMGDKTQIAVAGMAITLSPVAVWVGASLALMLTSALGVWLGATIIRQIPIHRLHQFSGIVFLCLAVYASLRIF